MLRIELDGNLQKNVSFDLVELNSESFHTQTMFAINEFDICQAADVDHTRSIRGWIRTRRRIAQRCWWDQETINRARVFCQNSGACGSTYIVQLLVENGVPRAFHEKTPDLMKVGRQHYEQPMPVSKLVRMLRYTRHDVFFEANNRLFSLTRELATSFPNAKFLYLHRDGTEAVRSAMSKPNVENYLVENIGFRGSIAGSAGLSPFTRFCHYWSNLNGRIFNDLQTVIKETERGYVMLRFEDLVQGKVQPLEDLIGRTLKIKTRPPVNVRPTRSEGKFPPYKDWTASEKRTFAEICGPVMSLIGR